MSKKAKMNHPRAVATQWPQADVLGDADSPFAEGVHDELDQALRYRLIGEAAYSLYCKRGYVDGYDVDDWLEAEAQVDHMVLNQSTEASKLSARR